MTTLTSLPLASRNTVRHQVQGSATLDGHRLLMPIVQKVVDQISSQALVPVTAASRGLAFQPQALLALLTYFYAAGTYGSQDVEAALRKDNLLRFVCVDELPDWHTLRRFRRCNREVVRQCLEQTLRLVWAAQEPVFNQTEEDVESRGAFLNQRGSCDLASEEAAARVERAVWLDSVALD